MGSVNGLDIIPDGPSNRCVEVMNLLGLWNLRKRPGNARAEFEKVSGENRATLQDRHSGLVPGREKDGQIILATFSALLTLQEESTMSQERSVKDLSGLYLHNL